MLVKLLLYLKTKINNSRQFIEDKHPSRLGARRATKIFLLEMSFVFIKYLLILFKKPSKSFKILVNQPALDDCNYSYTEHKSFQKRLRVFSVAGFTALAVATIISSLILNLATGPIFQSKAATYTFNQTSWSGGATSNNASHTSNQTGWNQYSAKDTNINTSTAGEIKLAQVSNSQIQTSSADFSAGTFTNTQVSGLGNDAIVQLTGWTKEIANSMRSSGPDLDLDSNNKAHICFEDYNADDQEYTTNSSGSWVATTILATSNPGIDCSIVVDSNDKPRVVFLGETSGSYRVLRYATKETGSWVNTIIASGFSYNNVGRHSIALDQNNKVYIAYYSSESGGVLKLATNVSGSWDTSTVIDSSNVVGTYPSIARDSNNKFHVVYYDTTNSNLKYATNASGSWAASTIDNSSGDVGIYTSLSVDSNDKIHASYYDTTNGDLKYATNASGLWVASTVASNNNVGKWTSIKTDSNNKAHIGYYDVTDNDIVYTTNQSGSWQSAVVESNVGGDTSPGADNRVGTSLDKGTDNKWHVAYYTGAGNGQDVYYAYNQPSGTFQSSVIDMGSVLSYTTLDYTATASTGTTLTVDARAGNTATPDGTWTSWQTGIADLGSISALNGNRYVQYKLNFTTASGEVVPYLSDIIFNYTQYPSSAQTLTFSVYNTTNTINTISNFSWTEDASMPSGSALQFQIRTSADNSIWTSFLGPDGTTSAYFSNSGTGCSNSSGAVTCSIIPSIFTSGSNDRYIQYKAYFTSNNLTTATLYDTNVQYAANAPPDFDTSFNATGVTAVQNSDGTVTIQYK